MKNLYIIGGTMGIGKTAACQELKRMLNRAVFLDGDWCWDADPFVVTQETKALVLDNICYVLNSFLHCSVYEHVIFCWVLHQQELLDELCARLDTRQCRVRKISLLCREEVLSQRLQGDIDAGRRDPEVLARSLARLPLYGRLDTVHLDVSDLTPEQTARRIAGL